MASSSLSCFFENIWQHTTGRDEQLLEHCLRRCVLACFQKSNSMVTIWELLVTYNSSWWTSSIVSNCWNNVFDGVFFGPKELFWKRWNWFEIKLIIKNTRVIQSTRLELPIELPVGGAIYSCNFLKEINWEVFFHV